MHMKKIFYYMMMIAALTTACNKDDGTEIEPFDPNISQISLTTKLTYVSIILNGYGTVYINLHYS